MRNKQANAARQFDVNTKAKIPKVLIKPEMLVQHTDGSIGIVTQVTKKNVHVVWLVNTNPAILNHDEHGAFYHSVTKQDMTFPSEGTHHYLGYYKRNDLAPLPVGTVVTFKQVER